MPKVLVETAVLTPSSEPDRSVITCRDEKEALAFIEIKFHRLEKIGKPFTFLYTIEEVKEEVDSDA